MNWSRSVPIGLALTLGVSLTTSGCKKKSQPEIEVFDEQATPAEADALAALAPPWPTPERTELRNGLLVHWLAESGSPAVHMRLLMPLPARSEGVAAAAIAVQALALELETRLRRYQGRVELSQKPGRVEVVIHARRDDLAAVTRIVGRTLGRAPSSRMLALGRESMQRGVRDPTPSEQALAALIDHLRGAEAQSEQIDKDTVAAATDDALARGWSEMTNPRNVVMVVHAGLRPQDPDASAALSSLASSWTRRDGRALAKPKPADDSVETGKRGAHLRLGIPMDKGPGGGAHLLLPTKEQEEEGRDKKDVTIAPVVFLETPGQKPPTLFYGRLIPTPTDRDRSMARLAQRVLQEVIDVRLTISGTHALVAVKVPVRASRRGKAVAAKPLGGLLDSLTGSDEDGEQSADERGATYVLRSVRRFQKLATRRETAQRLFQAAELWLGARMVEASLRGEDWTALWSDAIDLSVKDIEITSALARDARGMLDATPEALLEWQQRWLDPGGGEPGWMWVLAGDPDQVRAIVRKLGAEPEEK